MSNGSQSAEQGKLLARIRVCALALMQPMQALVATEPKDRQATWNEYLALVQELVQPAEAGATSGKVRAARHRLTLRQRHALGKLLRDKRNAAGLSRVQLARKAKLSDATVKFAETARHPPSRATLIRLVGVGALKLSWAELPGQIEPPVVPTAAGKQPDSERCWLHAQLNCFLTPSYDPLATASEFSRFLDGAGGYVEQTHAYLDPESASGYLAMAQQSIIASELRAGMPLVQVAGQIVEASGPVALQVVALGSGDGTLETRLVSHLLDAQVPSVELCLLDISQPLLTTAYLHAAKVLADIPQAHVVAVQCDFHQLPLYPQLYRPCLPTQRRLFCLLGGTLANLDQETRFLRQTLLGCVENDLLLLDIESVSASCDRPAEIKRRDKLYRNGVSTQLAAWLGGPIWRRCKEVTSINFAWRLETHCSIPGSYALHAIATVKSPKRADRQFSMFRFARYDPAKLAECLGAIGWEEIGALVYGESCSLRLYRKRGHDDVANAGG